MSVISTLRDRATTTPSDEAFVFMDYDTKTGDQIDRMTWSQLYSRVTAVSAYLISYGRHADRRRTAAISAPQGLDYVAGFLGALCAGWAPVPLPEPLGSLRDKRTGLAVLDCAADVVLTTSQAETRVRATIATHGASVTTPVIALDTLDEPSGDNCDLDSQLSECAITAYPDRGFTNAGTFAESGGFLKDVAGFDNRFFDIPPDEALRMDPQQRLLLEVSWEALEHAGIIPESLRLSRTGVFVGVSSTDYVRLVSASAQQKSTIWDNTGGSSSIIANRISYFLDIQGPSIVIDTACSSSLVAVHLACRSLSTWDCDIALVGGTNVLISPEPWGGFREAGILSQTGCCHAFDKSADGMVRGEGCGVIVLQRLSDARLEGRRILAILTGSAVNQDGKSNGIMAPNPSAQIGVLENACKSARVDPLEIGYVEAHGTGTSLGDRIEAHALGMVFGRKRPGSGPLMIGSIKPNIGHLEGAAGIAGLIKAGVDG